jgi:Tol biopolymer transport system component
MPLTAGTRIGVYEITAAIGAGGMGEVYRAHDPGLARDVAIKMLPERTVKDPAALARFQREAHLLAALNQPNVGAIYGLVESAHGPGLVLEFIDGPTLSEIIARSDRGVPLDHALDIARQIVEALDAAHERGIVHRDLKPANVKVTPGGTVKVLDFGLAKALDADTDERSATSSHSPTITSPAALTRDGVMLGTVAYMSPEQARGRAVDKRSDIWSFGCVLFEMLTGRRAFEGETVADTISAVLSREPDWTRMQSAPAGARRLLKRCLEKDPRHRLRDIGDARAELDDLSVVDTAGVGRTPVWTTGRIVAAAAVVVALAAAAFGAGAWLRRTPVAAPSAAGIRFHVAPPERTTFYNTVETVPLAVSPDGSRIGFVAESGGVRRIWIRPLDSLEVRPVEGTDDATSLFWSPDSESIGFFAGNRLRRMNLSAGAATTVCEVPTGVGLFGSWGSAGHAVFASIEGDGIYRVPMSGGEPVAVVKPDPTREARLIFPTYLPDDEGFLYTSHDRDGGGHVMLGRQGQPSKPLFDALSNVQYAPPGLILYARESSLFAVPFDLETERLTGEPIGLGEPVRYMFGPGRGIFSASSNGVLAFQSYPNEFSINWVNRDGRETPVTKTGDYFRLRISPDGSRALFDRMQPDTGAPDVWEIDLVRGIERRLTSGPEPEGGGMITPDGRSAFLAIARAGPPRMHRMDLASGTLTPLLPQRGLQEPDDVSGDGKSLLFSERVRGEYDLWALPLTDDSPTPIPIIRAPFSQFEGRFSRDGHWIAFMSNESGRSEVYVTSFPKADATSRVSPGGGRAPRWSRNGDRLFYISATQELMSVPVVRTNPLVLGSPTRVFSGNPVVRWINYDVAPDERFLAVVIRSLAGERPLTVRTNWTLAITR